MPQHVGDEPGHALPLSFGLTEVTIATCEPLDVGWVSEIESHTRRTIKLVIVNPIEIARYTTEFYALSRSVRNATKMGESAALANFEQLVELGKSNKQLDANDSGVIQVVDWLWQYAFDQRASDIHLEPRRERSVIRFRIDGVMAIQASLTGHLVFSTLHTNDSASAITRLNDLGVAPYLIGSTLIGVLAQRLVRTLCPACKAPDPDVTRDTLHEVVKPCTGCCSRCRCSRCSRGGPDAASRR